MQVQGCKLQGNSRSSPGLSEAGYSKAGKPTARRGGNPGLQRAWLLTVAAGGDRGDFFPDTGTAARRRRGQGSGFRVQVKTSSRNSPGLSEAGYSKSRLRAFAAVASLALTSFFLASLAAWREFFPVFLSIVSSLQSIVSSLRRWRRLR